MTSSYLDTQTTHARGMVQDVSALLDQLRPLPEGEQRRGVTLIKHLGFNIVAMVLRAGAELSEHSVRGVLAVQVLEGRVRLTTVNAEDELPAGHLAVLEVLEPHSLTALEDSALLITVSMLQETGAAVSNPS